MTVIIRMGEGKELMVTIEMIMTMTMRLATYP